MAKQLVVSDPKVMMGKPVIAGTRITVELVLEKRAAGESVDAVQAAHPRLTREGIYAAMSFATDAIKEGIRIWPR